MWYILWAFGIVYGYLVYFSRFGILQQKKSGNPGFQRISHSPNLSFIRAESFFQRGKKRPSSSRSDG
jgi:hypothetical protein